jgi:hypothetical protein
MNLNELVGWLNHNLALNWSDEIAKARDIITAELEKAGV